MRALTLWPEWAWAILHLDKRYENRGRGVPPHLIGERIAIHAGKTIGGGGERTGAFDAVAAQAERAGWDVDWTLIGRDVRATFSRGRDVVELRSLDEIVTSAIVGTVVLAGPAAPGHAVPWGAYGEHAWPLADVRRLRHPIPHKGALGPWIVPDPVAQVVASAPSTTTPWSAAAHRQESP